MGMRQLENIVSATQALQEALVGLPALASLRIEDCVKAATDRAVFRGHIDGEPVIAKLSYGPGAATEVVAQAAELRHHAARMSDGPYRVPGLIAALPRHGLLIMECAPGQRLSDAMQSADGPERTAMVARAGHWLAHLTAERRRDATLAAGYWLRRTADAAAQATPEDRPLLEALVAWMTAQSATLDGATVTQVHGHGDFCPLNLIVEGGVLWGIHLQARRWFALERDLARFLVVSRLGLGRPATIWRGVDRDHAESLLSPPDLNGAADWDEVLPFFLASEMGRRLVSEAANHNKRSGLRSMIDDFLGGP